MRNARTLIAAIIVVLGILAIVAGIIYLTTEAKSLPSVLGSLHNYTGHRTKRGIAALVIGVVLLFIGGGIFAYRPRDATA